MTYQPRQKKALWHRAKFGEVAQPKQRKPVRRVSKSLARERRLFSAEFALWIVDKMCAGSGLRDSSGKPWCGIELHSATDPHHLFGRLGPLLRMWALILPMCRPGHDRVKRQPAEAKRLGLLGDGPWNSKPK